MIITIEKFTNEWLESAGNELKGIQVNEILENLVDTMKLNETDKYDFEPTVENAETIKNIIDECLK